MADRTKHVGVTPVNNPLLSAAGSLFPYENFASAAQLVPISQRGPSISLSEDVGEVDSFLGQDALPSIPLPGVLPPELKKPSAEQLQPITFYNAQGQPTGGAGIDFLGPAGVSHKSRESAFLTRHKQFASHRRPVAQQATTSSPLPSLPPVPVTSLSSLKSQPTKLVPSSSEPLSIKSEPLNSPLPSSKLSPLLQEPTLVSKTLLLPPKSQSTPPSPSNQFHLPTSSNQPLLAVSKSQPSTASPSPSHKPQASSLVSQTLSPPSEEPSVGETWSNPTVQGKQFSVSQTRYNTVKSFAGELASPPEKVEKSSSQTQFASKSVSESVPLESSSSVQSSEETSAHISAAPLLNFSSESQNLLTKNESSSFQVSEISTSLTETENLTVHPEPKSSNQFDSFISKSEESLQSPQYQPTTVSLISATTAEALLSLSVGKRLSGSEIKTEVLPVESFTTSEVGFSGLSIHSNPREDKQDTVNNSESIPSQDPYISTPGHISSKEEVSVYPGEKYLEKSIQFSHQEGISSQSPFSSSDKEDFPRVQETSAESHKDKCEESFKAEHIPEYNSKLENTVTSFLTAEVLPSLPTEGRDLKAHSQLPVSESQFVESHSEKVITPDSNHFQATTQVSADRSKDLLEPTLFPSQERKPDKTESSDSCGLPETKAASISPTTPLAEASLLPEARLPTTSELNLSNHPTPQYSPSTQPNQPSSRQGTLLVQSAQSQYCIPSEQPTQPPEVHQEKPPPREHFTPRTESNHFPPNQPAHFIPNQSFGPGTQNQSPLFITPTYQPSHHLSGEQNQSISSQAYQSPSESSQFPSNQAGQHPQGQLVDHLTPGQTPIFFTPTAPIKQPLAVQLGQPRPSQFYAPTAASQTPLSHYTTSTSTHQFIGQYFTPENSNFHSPAPPPQGSQPPISQSRQEFPNQYLIPSTQANHPPVHLFTPTAQVGQSAQNQNFTPPLKTDRPLSHTPPDGTHQPNSSQFTNFPPRPPSNHSLPPPPLAPSALPPQPPPGHSLPPLRPPSTQSPFPHTPPILTPSATSLPPPSQSQFPPPPSATGLPPTPTPSQYPHAPHTLTPSATGLPPPPPPKSNFTSSPNVNQYSIHAKSQHSRRPYIAPSIQPQRDYFQPSPLPPLPVVQALPSPESFSQQTPPTTYLVPNQLSAPPVVPPPSAPTAPSISNNLASQAATFLVPNQSSSPSPLSSVPLTPAATPPAPCNGAATQSVASSQLPPPSAQFSTVPSPSLKPSLPPAPRQPNYNPFSARTPPPPQGSLQQQLPIQPVPLPPPPPSFYQPQSTPLPPLGNSESVPLGSPAESSTSDTHPYSSAPPVIVASAQSEAQGYTSDLTHTVNSLRSVPYNSSVPPPGAIPEGGPKNYRLGKQRPRYAQVPDLAVSPLAISPVYSPNSSESLYGATPSAAEPFPIYPPGSQQLIASEDYFVPSENSLSEQEGIPSSFFNLATQPGSAAAAASGGSNSYRPVYCHWFFKKEVETKVLWKPFSLVDSLALESSFNASETNDTTIVPTDGGRYDVHVSQRQRNAVFWEEKNPTEVRRCSWFYKGPLDSRYTPYEEEFAAKLEEEYKICMEANKWNRKIEHNGETVILHGPVVMVHYSPTGSSDQLSVPADTSPVKPRVVKRGVEEFEIEEGEPAKVDHLLFLVHGIGSVCDLKFRDVVETVDDFRSLALQLTRSHFSMNVETNQVNRVEVLPVSWHWKLHGEDTGIDRKLNSITLKSIPRLRNFTNDTLLDILFYTSPVYCQTIMDTVGNEMNRMYEMFLKRNPDFQGSVSVGGHSLGSLILFDLLYHQKVPKNLRSSPSIIMTGPGAPTPDTSPDKGKVPASQVAADGQDAMEEDDVVNDEAMALAFSRSSSNLSRRASRVNYMMGTAGTGQPHISYPQLNFRPENFFALGSPIGMFVTVRGIESLGDNFHLPTCPGFFNIFHPFDPVAYRIESLIDPELAPTLKPVTIPHHKGRKRMHLELKETMARVGSDLKNKLVDSVKNTWNTMTQYSMFSRPEPSSMESEVTKAIEAHLGPSTVSAPVDIGGDSESEGGDPDADVGLGCLNRGRRVDYVLQEAPLESFNEYLFALQSHVCYWESEDTMLMILTEIYRSSNVKPDSVLTGAEREKSPMKLLSDQFLASASPPKPQFSALRFPSSTSLSSEGSASSLGVSRSQSVPKMMNDPNLATLSTSSPGYLESLGQPPQLGMDPTAPMTEVRNLAPPPMGGFVKQALQRK